MAKTPTAAPLKKAAVAESKTALASGIISRWSKLEQDRNYWMSMWQQLGEYVMPRKSYVLNTTITPTTDRETKLFDSTAVQANMILAAGCMSYITPADSRWCGFEAPEDIEDGEGVAEYFAEVTEIVMETLARSNFYTTIHECFLDRGAFGTAALYVEPGDQTPLHFKNFDIGTFCISENHEGYCDTLFRKYEMTVRQLVQAFGIENVSDGTRKAFNKDDGKGYDEKVEIIHAIYPREKKERDLSKKDGPNKPIASVYVEVKNKHAIKVGGFDELPFFATRYLKWQSSAYGWSPSWVALPEIRQLNFLQKQLDALAELAAFPRILVPDSMESTIDLRAGGVTYFSTADQGAIPKEWATTGRYDIGIQRVQEKQRKINEAFSVPLFQLFTQEENAAPNRMTATEVNARNAERLSQFSPTFSRLTTELLTPLLRRIYGILARNGALPEPPQALIQVSPDGMEYLPEPQVVFNSRIALAVKSMEIAATDRGLQRAMGLVQLTQDPTVLDNFDTDKIAREGAIADGMDPEFLRDTSQRDQMRQQRQAAQQQQADTQQQAHVADMAQKAGSIKKDSVLGTALSSAQKQ
jgi:hypothetical protein